MRRVNALFRSTARRLRQRGSALLAALMVITGLSLLGLAFVAISETESSISINERNHTEAVAVAESGAKLVVQWFQDPQKMDTAHLLPPNDNTLKNQRTIYGVNSFYKEDLTQKLCDLPFGPKDPDKFFGAEDTADVVIDRSTTAGQTFIDDLNNRFLGVEGVDARPAGEITQIKIFAPPIVGASLTAPNPPHWYEGGTRYGVATIMVRAEKFDRPLSAGAANRKSLALAECRIVISQFPTPQPAGPLQSSTALATNGSFNVHWGMITSQQSLDLKKDYTAMPWFNAWEPIQFQRGYDSSVEWQTNKAYIAGDVVRPVAATITANPLLKFHEYMVTVAGNSGGVEPTWPTTPAGQTVSLNGVTYQERGTTAWPLSMGGAANATNTPWLYYVASGSVSVDDPWFQARAAQNVVSVGTPGASPPTSNPQPWSFFPWTGSPDPKTHVFQFQSLNSYPNYKQVVFPIFNYDYWKAAAIAGNGQGEVHYLQWVSADTYTDGQSTKTFRNWVASATSNPGFYFFETQNRLNPQNGGGGILAPDVTVNGGSVAAYMSSFVYLNANFATQGLGGITGHFNQPGEPYLDIGYRKVDLTSATGDFERDAAGMPIVEGAANRQWDHQELPWSNTGATGAGAGTQNGTFDVCVGSRTVHDPSSGVATSTYTGWFPLPYRPGCKPGNNVDLPACNCSEPHEPYLNIRYAGTASGITFGWFDPATAVTTMRQPKLTGNSLRTGTPITCTASSTQTQCTSNAYDEDGGLVDLTPVSDGVLYMEGNFDSTGNADYYGAVLVGGTVNTKGTPTIWYDESLSRGLKLKGFPRVMITSLETDR